MSGTGQQARGFQNADTWPAKVLAALVTGLFCTSLSAVPRDDPALNDTPAAVPEVHPAGLEDAEVLDDQEPGEGEETRVDVAHSAISRGVNAAALWVDSFFDDERVVAEEAYTRIKLSVSEFREQGENFKFGNNVGLNVNLPRTERTLKFFVFRDNEDDELDERGVGSSPATEKQDTAAGFQYFLKSTGKINLSWRVGVKLGGDREIFTGPRYRKLFALDPWLGRFTQQVLWGGDRGWQSRTRFDFERLTHSKKYFFRSTLEGTWREEDPGYKYDIVFQLTHKFSRRQAIIYEQVNTVKTRPNHALDESIVRTRLRRRIWRKWLFAEVAPQVAFRNEDDFDTTPGVLFKLEVILGGQKYWKKKKNQ